MKTNIIQFPGTAADRRVVGTEPAARKRTYKVKGKPVGRDYQPEAGWKPLSNKQKAKLVMLATDAAGKQYLPTSGKEHDAWRAEQSILACGFRISEARQKDWADLLIHWQQLCGQDAQAFKTAMHTQGNPQRVAMFKLTQELKKQDKSEAYAETICMSKFKVCLRDATAPQVWSLVFDLRGRAK